MTNEQSHDKPAYVPLEAKQAGELHARWAWAEATVWTERMLTALEQGVKGGVWFSLIDKVFRPQVLAAAFTRVKANAGAAGVDHQSVGRFEQHKDANLSKLADELKAGTYQPQDVRRVWIPKPGKSELRPLGIPTVRDRVVQTALRGVLEPIFERDFAACSYGFRPGRGCKDALRQVDALLQAGHTWVVDADLKGYFDTIPHTRLMARVRQKVADGRVLQLLEAYLHQGVMDGMKTWKPTAGTPQGAVISPLLSNIYLDPLDQAMESQGQAMVRYADDFVVLCRTEAEARKVLEAIRVWTEAEGLQLHPEKTRIVNAAVKGGFDFLGYHFERGRHWPSKKSQRKLRDALRPLTKRANGESLDTILSKVNAVLRGWFEYFKHGTRNVLEREDQWLRQRLRGILRHRRKLPGIARGPDFTRWNLKFFAEVGLLSLAAAHRSAGRSSRR